MFKPQSFEIQEMVTEDDGLGGVVPEWKHYGYYKGYLDLSNGTNQSSVQNAIIEQSTHVLIIPGKFDNKPKDKMRVIDGEGRYYTVNYVDDPLGQGHHLELAMTYGGTADEQQS